MIFAVLYGFFSGACKWISTPSSLIIDSGPRCKPPRPHDQLNGGHGLWDRRTIWCLLHLHRSDNLLELWLCVNNLRPNQASGGSSVCRIKARTFKDSPSIHLLLRRNSYCWRSSLQFIYVVETYAIFGTEHLGRIVLFLYSTLPIFQKKENPVALKRCGEVYITRTTLRILSYIE